MRCTGVSCWYLLVFLGPQSMNKNRSCFFVHVRLLEKRSKSTTNYAHTQAFARKGPKRTINISRKSSTFAGGKININFTTMKGLSFSLKRAVGISGLKTKVASKTGIPTTKQGLERKIGGFVLSVLTGRKRK